MLPEAELAEGARVSEGDELAAAACEGASVFEALLTGAAATCDGLIVVAAFFTGADAPCTGACFISIDGG